MPEPMPQRNRSARQLNVPYGLVGMPVGDAKEVCENDGLILTLCEGSEPDAGSCVYVTEADYEKVITEYHHSTQGGDPINVGQPVGVIAVMPAPPAES